jgi:hypothetical protein
MIDSMIARLGFGSKSALRYVLGSDPNADPKYCLNQCSGCLTFWCICESVPLICSCQQK